MKLFEFSKRKKSVEPIRTETYLNQFYAPVKGLAKDISNAPDAAYSQKLVGDGILILPSDNKIYAPCDCTVAFLFPSGHAIGLRTTLGTELFLHIGFEMEKLHDEDFSYYVAEDQQIKKGQLICEMNLEKIKQLAKSPAVMLLATNLMDTEQLILNSNKNVTMEDIIFEIR